MALNWDRARKQALEIDNKYNTVRSVTPGASSSTAYVPGTTKYTAAANITPKRTVTTLPNVSTPTADRARLGLASGWNPASSSLSRFTRERELEAEARAGSETEVLKLRLDTLNARQAALEKGLPALRAAEQPSEVARESLMRTAQGWSQRQELGQEPERGSDRVSERIEALERERSALLPQYYAAKNEATLRRMEGDAALKSLYAQAKGLREDLDRAGLVEAGTGTENGEAYRAAWDGLKEKYGVSRAAELPALHERLLREFDALEEQLAAQGVDYEYLRSYEQMAEDRAAYERTQAETEAYAREHPVMASVESVLKSPMQGLDLLSLGTPGAGRNDPDSPDTYVPLNVYGMDVSNFVNTVRGTVSEEIEQNTDWELFGQNVASFLYQTGMSVADSAAQVALFGPGATYLMGASAAANQAREVIERGGTNRQALLSGLAAGAAEALFEKVSIDRLLSERDVTTIADWLRETLKQAGTEASEEMLTEVSNLLSDAAIMGSGSSFAAMVERHRQEGLSEEESRRRAFLDCLSQVSLAGVGGALSGGVMGGTVRGVNYLSGAWNQVQSARANRPTNAALLDNLNQHLSQPGQVESDLRPLPFRSNLENRALQTLPMSETSPVITLPNPSVSNAAQSENAAPWAAVQATGQNNTASSGEADMGLIPITEQAATRLSSGKNNIIARKASDIISFVRNALRKKGGPERLYMGTIPDSAANTIRDATGVNVSGYTAILPGDSVQHIFKNHGTDTTESARGQRAVTEDDIALIPQVLSNPDSVSLSNKTDALGRPVLLLTKRIGDTYITAQAVTDGRHALTTNSLWIQKEKNRPTIPDAELQLGPEGNARSALSQDSSELSIPQIAQDVNQQVKTILGETGSNILYTKNVDAMQLEVQAKISDLAKSLGRRVKFVDAGNGINGFLKDGTIYISKYAQNPAMEVFKHELTHTLEKTGTYQKLERLVLDSPVMRDFLESMGQQGRAITVDDLSRLKQLEYAERGVTLSSQEARREVVADFVQANLFTDEASVRALAEQDRNLAERILDWIQDMLIRLKGTEEEKFLRQAEQLYRKALQESQRTHAESTRYSIGSAEVEGAEYAGAYSAEERAEAARLWQEMGTDSPYFKRFYNGNSPELYNQDGSPKVVYHGTADNITQFEKDVRGSFTNAADAKMGFFFTSNEQVARGYAKNAFPYEILKMMKEFDRLEALLGTSEEIDSLYHKARNIYEEALMRYKSSGVAGIIIKAYLSMKNPLVVDYNFNSYRQNVGRYADFIQQAVNEGRDGVIFKNTYDGFNSNNDEASDIFVIFEPGQIKSATQNQGTFDSVDPDIRYSMGQSFAQEYQRLFEKYGDRLFEVQNEADESVGAARAGFDPWSSHQGTRSQFYPEGSNAARPVDVPTTDPQGRPIRRTASTAMGAKAIPDEAISDIQNMVLRGELSYGRVTDKASIDRAVKTIEDKTYQGALEEFRSSVRRGVVSKDIATLGQQLLINAANAGDSKATAELLSLYAQMETAAGQAVQAASILRKLSPSDQLYAAQRDVIELEKTLQKEYKDLELTIDPALIEAFQQQATQEGRDQVLDKIYQNVADQVPATWKDKWNAWRYLAMLANPRTHVRNVVGNVGFQPLRMAKDRVAAAIEAGVSKASGGTLQRTKSFAVNPALFRAAWGDWANVKETLSGSKYNDVKSQIESRRRIFTLPVLEGVRKGNSSLLELEDAIFKRITYADALAGYLQANGVTADQIRDNTVDAQLMAKARDYAGQEALRATYQDRNAFSDKVVQVANVLGPFGEAVLPFKRTPANILVRGFEYSPAGLAKSLTSDLYQVKRGNMTGAEAIDHISAGLTGSALFALGAYLFSQGIVTSGGGDDEKQDEINDLTGRQNYALNLPGGGSVTLDWLAPEALPFFMGVELMDSMGQNGFTAESIMDSLSSISGPMLELSMLQSLNDLLDSISYAASSQKVPGLVESALISYFTQAVPTLFGQLERTGEDKRMSTYTDQNKTLPTNIQYALGRASARIPGWDYQQIPYIDAWGREEKTGTLPMRAMNNFLNPAYTSSMNVTPVDEEIQRLYNATGDGSVVPSRPERDITVDEIKIDLSKEQYEQYGRTRGQTQFDMLESMIDSPAYQSLSDVEKAAAVTDVYKYSDAMAKAEISDYEPEDWMLNVQNAKRDLGVSPAEYIMLHSKYGGGLTEGDKVREAYQAGIPARSYLEYAAKKKDTDGSGGVSTRELAAAIENSGLPQNQKTELFFVEKPEWKEQAEEHGIDGDLFIQFKIATYGITGDKDRDGKTITNSKKKKVMDAINQLEISKEEKDALYYAAGYSASTIRDAPWR